MASCMPGVGCPCSAGVCWLACSVGSVMEKSLIVCPARQGGIFTRIRKAAAQLVRQRGFGVPVAELAFHPDGHPERGGVGLLCAQQAADVKTRALVVAAVIVKPGQVQVRIRIAGVGLESLVEI